jgi:hypothetical protein
MEVGSLLKASPSKTIIETLSQHVCVAIHFCNPSYDLDLGGRFAVWSQPGKKSETLCEQKQKGLGCGSSGLVLVYLWVQTLVSLKNKTKQKNPTDLLLFSPCTRTVASILLKFEVHVCKFNRMRNLFVIIQQRKTLCWIWTSTFSF